MNEKGFDFLMEILETDSTLRHFFKTKIILIHTNWSVKIYQANLAGINPQLEQAEYFDSYYQAGLKVLLENTKMCDYDSVFNLELSDFPVRNPIQKPKINSMSNYTMPTHFDALCSAIQKRN